MPTVSNCAAAVPEKARLPVRDMQLEASLRAVEYILASFGCRSALQWRRIGVDKGLLLRLLFFLFFFSFLWPRRYGTVPPVEYGGATYTSTRGAGTVRRYLVQYECTSRYVRPAASACWRQRRRASTVDTEVPPVLHEYTYVQNGKQYDTGTFRILGSQ